MLQGLRFLRGHSVVMSIFGIDLLAMVFGMPRALFPALAERLSGRTSLDGRLALQGTVKRGGGRSEVAAKARLGGVDVRRGLFSLRGDVAADVRASASGDDATISLDADLGGAAIDVALLAKKRAGAPARVAFTLAKAKDSVRVSGARVELPGLALAGVEVSVEPHALRVTCGPASTIVMTQLLEGAAPLVRARVPAWMETATVRFGLDLAGDPDDLAAASLTIPSFVLAIAPGHVRGSAFIDAVGKPRKVRFDVTGGQLAWPDRPAGAGSEELALDLPSDVSVEGRVHLDALRAGGHAATDVDLAIALDEGRVHVASLRAGIFGGTVRLLPSTLDLSDVPDLDLHARFEGLDLGAVPRGSTDELGGRLAGSLDVRGRGATAAAIWASLRGEAALTARDLHAKGAWEPSYKLTNRWLAALAERRRTQAPPAPSARTLDLREVSASLTLDRGKIATRAPIVLRSDDLEARLEGAVGADGILALEGRAEFSARSVAERSGGALAPKAAVPLRLRIGGRLGAPEIELFDLADTLRAIRGAAPIGADAPF